MAAVVKLDDYWESGDGDDYSPAFGRIQDEFSSSFDGVTVQIENKLYTCETAVDVIMRMIIEGLGGGGFGTADATQGYEIPTLHFPNSTGFVTHHPRARDGTGNSISAPDGNGDQILTAAIQINISTVAVGMEIHISDATDPDNNGTFIINALGGTAGLTNQQVRYHNPGGSLEGSFSGTWEVGGTYAPDRSRRTPRLLVRGLVLRGAGSESGLARFGVHVRAPVDIEDCLIWHWGGNAVRMICDSSSIFVSDLGNANGARIHGTRIFDCGDSGLVTDGGDSNVCLFSALSFNDCSEAMQALETEPSASINVAARLFTIPVTSHPFTRGQLVQLIDHPTVNFTLGVVMSDTTSTSLVVDTSAAPEVIANGTYAADGTVRGYRTAVHNSSFIGNTYLRCSFAGAGSSDGTADAITCTGGGRTSVIDCYTESNLWATIQPPSWMAGGQMRPRSGNFHLTTSNASFEVPQLVAGRSVASGTVIGSLGGSGTNTGFEISTRGGSGTLRLQREQSSQGVGFWEWVDANVSTLVPLRIGHEGNTREGRGYPEVGMPTLFVGRAVNPSDGGTVIRGAIEWRSNGGVPVRLEVIRVFSVTSADTSTPLRLGIGTHDLPSGLSLVRFLVRNVAGNTVPNGDRRASRYDSNEVHLYDSAGSALAGSGSYTANTGIAIWCRFRGIGLEAPTSGAWARGDIVDNAHPAVGDPLYWICTATGSPGTWEDGPDL